MPKVATPLTDTTIKKSKVQDKEYKLSDGQGLYLVIRPNGTKFFRYDYTYLKKRKSMSFGVYPDISLKEARDKREECKELLKKGLDPIENKKAPDDFSFRSIADKWMAVQEKEWKPNTITRTKGVIVNYAYPRIGDKNIKDITRIDILELVQEIQNRGISEGASRLLNYIERIYKYAVTFNIVDHNIVADIDKKNALGRQKVAKHFPAVTKPLEIKKLLEDIKSYSEAYKADISTIYALQIAPYLFLRPYNLRNLEWQEVDFKNRVLDIPGAKMKMGKDFYLPLSHQAIALLEKMKPYSYHDSKYVFPSTTSKAKTISENTLNHALMRLGYKNIMTTHGFRAMFSTIAHENTNQHGFNSDIIESCLAHEESNKIKAAYNRESKVKYLNEKRELIQWWADWLEQLN